MPQDEQSPFLVRGPAPGPVDFRVPSLGAGENELAYGGGNEGYTEDRKPGLAYVGVTPALWVTVGPSTLCYDLNNIDTIGNVDSSRNKGRETVLKEIPKGRKGGIGSLKCEAFPPPPNNVAYESS